MGPWCAAARVAAVVCVLALCARPVPAADESPPKAPGEPPAGAAPEPPGRVITYANDALTVRLANVAVDEVLDELGRQAGAEIRGGVLNPRIVSTEFDA